MNGRGMQGTRPSLILWDEIADFIDRVVALHPLRVAWERDPWGRA